MSSLLSIQGVSRTHLVSPTREQIETLSQQYDLHDLIIDDVLENTTQDKIDVKHMIRPQVNILSELQKLTL